MMNALYSWLQDAVKVEDLTDYLYWFDLKTTKGSKAIMEQMYQGVDELLDTAFTPETMVSVHCVDTLAAHVHAHYDPNIQSIEISNQWLGSYENFMDAKTAYLVHLEHECFHVRENQTMWYSTYKYALRHRISEVSAIYYSQRKSGLSIHPRLAEFAIGLDAKNYTKEDIATYLKERVKDYEIYRFA